LNAETGPRKSPPETTCPLRDQEGPESIAEIPAQKAYLNLTGNYPIPKDCVVETRWIETGCPPLSLSNESPVGARNGNFLCRDRATKSAILARIQRQRLRKPKNQGRMSLTSRTYCECLFHTTTTESGWWGRNRSKLGAHHPVIEPVSNLTQGREFSMQTERQNRRVACVHAIHWLDPSYSRYAPPIKKRSSTILPFCTVYRPTSSRFKRLLPFGVTSILKRTTN